jgi:hypothetical protein
MIDLEKKNVRKNFAFFLAGFIEGEGSFTISIKYNTTTKYKIALDPVFYLYQHKSGKDILEATQRYFSAGKIYPKSGNEDVLVFSISTRRTLIEKVIPYFEKYGYPFSAKKETFDNFKRICFLLENHHHRTKEGLLECIEYAYMMNPQAKGKKRKFSLEQLKKQYLL